jgi:hypothetical protein
MRIKQTLTGALLTLGTVGLAGGIASASPIKPVPGHMIGGSVSCKPVVQTLSWWINVTDKSGFVTATENGVALPSGATSGSFTVHGPETVSFVLDNHISGQVNESYNAVFVPADSVCTPIPTTTVPPVTTTIPLSTTTVPPVVTTPPSVPPTLKPPVTIRPLPPTLISPVMPTPTAKVVPVPAPTAVQTVPAPQKMTPAVATSLAETGAPSKTFQLAILATGLLLFGYALLRCSQAPHKRKGGRA